MCVSGILGEDTLGGPLIVDVPSVNPALACPVLSMLCFTLHTETITRWLTQKGRLLVSAHGRSHHQAAQLIRRSGTVPGAQQGKQKVLVGARGRSQSFHGVKQMSDMCVCVSAIRLQAKLLQGVYS